MNKFILIALVSCAIYAVGETKGKFTECITGGCQAEIDAFNNMKQTKKQQCLETCNAEQKKTKSLTKEEKRAIKQCYRDNHCLKKDRFESAEFQALKTCADEKCPEEFKLGKKYFKKLHEEEAAASAEATGEATNAAEESIEGASFDESSSMNETETMDSSVNGSSMNETETMDSSMSESIEEGVAFNETASANETESAAVQQEEPHPEAVYEPVALNQTEPVQEEPHPEAVYEPVAMNDTMIEAASINIKKSNVNITQETNA